MATDIIPQSYQNLHDWLENLLPKVPTQGPTLGMTPTEITDFTAVLTTLKTDVDAVLAAQAALDTATGILQQALTDNLPEIRRVIKNMKSSKGYNDDIGADLQIVAAAGSFDAENYKPTISAEAFPGYVRIKGKKLGADAFNIYMRLKGQPTFKLIATNRSRFPFDDDSPLAQPAQPKRASTKRWAWWPTKRSASRATSSVLYGG